jgi:CRISPR/Cas system CMR subunit Cmr4 (Cas7 group RAMP superfamily)
MTTVAQQIQPEPITKTIIHAFPNLESAKANANAFSDPQLVALPIPVVHVLFQMLAMKPIDSIVFFETSANLQSGVEISRENLQNLIELRLQSLQGQSQLPPDIA